MSKVKPGPALYNFLNKKYLWEPSHRSTGKRTRTNFGKFKWSYLTFWNRPEWVKVQEFLKKELEEGRQFQPTYHNKSDVYYKRIFRSLVETPFEQTKICILGQDPYFKEGLADGLAFSTFPNVKKIPGSLQSIFAEYHRDTKFPYPRSGDLTAWARNGILLLNTVWTVRNGVARSHSKIDGKQLWQELTCEILTELNRRKDKMVFILWGAEARSWAYMIDHEKHLVLYGAHPSPRNRTPKGKYRFDGGQYFTKACEYLDISTKIWRLP